MIYQNSLIFIILQNKSSNSFKNSIFADLLRDDRRVHLASSVVGNPSFRYILGFETALYYSLAQMKLNYKVLRKFDLSSKFKLIFNWFYWVNFWKYFIVRYRVIVFPKNLTKFNSMFGFNLKTNKKHSYFLIFLELYSKIISFNVKK